MVVESPRESLGQNKFGATSWSFFLAAVSRFVLHFDSLLGQCQRSAEEDSPDQLAAAQVN